MPIEVTRDDGSISYRGREDRKRLTAGRIATRLIALAVAIFLLMPLHLVLAQAPPANNPPAAAASSPEYDGNWDVQVDPPAGGFVWPKEVKVKIPIPGQDEKLFMPSTLSPFFSMGYSAYESDGAQMWNLVTGKQVGQIKGKPSQAFKRAVSPDGKYLAILVLNKEQRCILELWSFETGKLIRSITDEQKPSVVLLDFGPNNLLCYYAIGGKSGPTLKLWDMVQGKLVREIPIKGQLNEHTSDFSPGHRYLASANYSHELTIFDLTTGKIAGATKLPSASELDPHLNTKSLRFSQDGNELCVLLNGSKETRITTLDVKTGNRDEEKDSTFVGDLVASIDGSASYRGPALECLPSGGYLISGSVWIDGPSGRVVWYLDNAKDPYNHEQRLPVPNGLVISEGNRGAKRLNVLPMPWPLIADSLKAIDEEKKAIVKPGQPVSLSIKIGKLQFGTPEETSKALTETLTERLAAEGIEVQDGQATTLRVNYQESEGNKLQEYAGRGQNPVAGGKELQATNGKLSIAWVHAAEDAKGKEKVVWSKEIAFTPQHLRIRSDDADAEKARNITFGVVKLRLQAQPLPYFIPLDSKLAQLPGKTELADPKLGGDARTKTILDAAKKRAAAKKKSGK
jgi:hypothetical protein